MSEHRARSASEAIVDRLSADPMMGMLVSTEARVSSVTNGRWSWLIDTGVWNIGSVHELREVAAAPGIFVSFIGGDQIETMPDDRPGIHLNDRLQARLKVGSFASHLLQPICWLLE